jgi:hypothetical protein
MTRGGGEGESTSSPRVCAARLRKFEADASSRRKAKNRRDGKRRSGIVLTAWQRKTTRRDQRALKGAESSREAAVENRRPGDARHGAETHAKTDGRAR